MLVNEFLKQKRLENMKIMQLLRKRRGGTSNDIVEKDANEAEHDAHDATQEKDANEEANDTVEKDANEVAHDAALETNPNEAAVEKGWVEVEDVVEEYAYSNEVGGGNTVAGDTEPEMVEERESEMNEDKEDVDSGFVDSDVGEDEVNQTDVSNRVVHNLDGLCGD
ncbi:hypothetical protein V6N11_060409 [Hibiscus sabdariffa]|uniref:Uncharacterized protein n=1 Tax=Hibiscus sabdariffa TaxID=183260 RepID=A0ABR2QQI7_9ROSI